MLAEFLTLVFPIGVYLTYKARSKQEEWWYGLSSVFVVGICVLTFSRAGWLTLAFQALLGAALLYRRVPLAARVAMGAYYCCPCGGADVVYVAIFAKWYCFFIQQCAHCTY